MFDPIDSTSFNNIKETNDVALDEAFEEAKENGQRLGMFKWQGVTRTIT